MAPGDLVAALYMITTITITVAMKLTGLWTGPWRSCDPPGSVDDNSDNDNSGDEGCIKQ